MTNATDLKTIFLKSPRKIHVETCVTLWYLFKTKKCYLKNFFDPFIGIFSPLPSTQIIKVICLIFFYELALKNWAMKMHFNSKPILSGLFSIGGAKRPPPQVIHRFRPPAFIRLKVNESCDSYTIICFGSLTVLWGPVRDPSIQFSKLLAHWKTLTHFNIEKCDEHMYCI